MDPDKLLDEAEAKLRDAAGMIQQQRNPAVITALATYAGACATLAGVIGSQPGPTLAEATQHVQDTLDGAPIQE